MKREFVMSGRNRERTVWTSRVLGIGLLLGLLRLLQLSLFRNTRAPELPAPVRGRRREIDTRAGRIAVFESGTGPPVLAIHSVNAAASGYEVRPFVERLPGRRVFVMELPGFGNSERGRRWYTPDLLASAIVDVADVISKESPTPAPVDAVALSLSAEYLGLAALERPDLFRSLTLVTPTGFESRAAPRRTWPALRWVLTQTMIGPPLFDLITSRASIRGNLMLTWGSAAIDKGLARYDDLTAHQPGAETPVFDFLCGTAWPKSARAIYDRLELPVWVAYGTRAAFHSFGNVGAFKDRENWRFEAFECGAFPHFEQPDGFFRSLQQHLAPKAGLAIREAVRTF